MADDSRELTDSDRSGVSRRHFIRTAAAGIVAASAAGASAIPLAPPDKQPPNLPIPSPAKKRLGFAIVGLGELAIEQILPAFAMSERCAPVALVSGHPEKARKIAKHYRIDPKNIYSYDNYDSIKGNPAIDIVYIVLPNSMHAQYTVRALDAAKHVLCEKPMAVTVQECQRMIDAGKRNNRKLMIAYRLRYEPYNQTVIEMMRKQEYGPIRIIESDNVQQVKAPNIRLSKELGGGPLMDVGIYCLNATRYLTGEEPIECSAMKFQNKDDPRFAEVPDRVIFQLRFPSGVLANCSCGFSSAVSRRYEIFCDKAAVQLDPAFGYRGQRLKVEWTKPGDEQTSFSQEIDMPHVDHFSREMDHFAECVEQDKTPLTPGEEGLKDIAILTKIQASASGEGAVKL